MDKAEFYQAIGQRVRKARRAAGLTQKVIAGQIGLSRPQISNIEQGRSKLSIWQLIHIAAKCGVEPQKLLDPGRVVGKHICWYASCNCNAEWAIITGDWAGDPIPACTEHIGVLLDKTTGKHFRIYELEEEESGDTL